MKWFLFALVGTLLNGFGLALLGESIMRRVTSQDAFNAWFWWGFFGLIAVNAGICFIVEAAKSNGRD